MTPSSGRQPIKSACLWETLNFFLRSSLRKKVSNKEYGQLCAEKEWAGYEPESFSLEYFMGALLPNLENDGVFPGVFLYAFR